MTKINALDKAVMQIISGMNSWNVRYYIDIGLKSLVLTEINSILSIGSSFYILTRE